MPTKDVQVQTLVAQLGGGFSEERLRRAASHAFLPNGLGALMALAGGHLWLTLGIATGCKEEVIL